MAICLVTKAIAALSDLPKMLDKRGDINALTTRLLSECRVLAISVTPVVPCQERILKRLTQKGPSEIRCAVRPVPRYDIEHFWVNYHTKIKPVKREYLSILL
jgi:hypothetical protein